VVVSIVKADIRVRPGRQRREREALHTWFSEVCRSAGAGSTFTRWRPKRE
jgi:hypothetical protein